MAKSLGINLSSPSSEETQKRRRFLLGSAIKSLFPKEYERTKMRRM